MSHAMPDYPLSDFEKLATDEEQIQYVETHLDEIVAGLRADKSIPPEDVEFLVDHLSRFRSQVEGGIPWEEFAKEFMQD